MLRTRLEYLNKARGPLTPLADTLMFSLNERKIDLHRMACQTKSEAACGGYYKLESPSYDVQLVRSLFAPAPCVVSLRHRMQILFNFATLMLITPQWDHELDEFSHFISTSWL